MHKEKMINYKPKKYEDTILASFGASSSTDSTKTVTPLTMEVSVLM